MSNKLTPHPHAEIIKAWADGHTIEYKFPDEEKWHIIVNSPSFCPDIEYRIYKEPKPDVKKYVTILKTEGIEYASGLSIQDPQLLGSLPPWVNLVGIIEVVFDGETGKPKSVSLVND